jgi:ribosomal-protein-alanine N-acetyltransferase
MVFLLGSTVPENYAVRATRVGLRPLHVSDYAAWSDLRSSSREQLSPFEPAWAENELGRSAFRYRLKHHQRETADDLGYAFGIFRLTDHKLLGGVSLSNVRRGVTQSAELGYWLGTGHCGQGYMSDAVGELLAYGFGTLQLHRFEAATLPDNLASIKVLERNGFRREGLVRSYLKINGVWRDHLLFGLLEDDYARARDSGSALGNRMALR